MSFMLVWSCLCEVVVMWNYDLCVWLCDPEMYVDDYKGCEWILRACEFACGEGMITKWV